MYTFHIDIRERKQFIKFYAVFFIRPIFHIVLGEALLKKIYARIGFSDNIIRAEVDTVNKVTLMLYKQIRISHVPMVF